MSTKGKILLFTAMAAAMGSEAFSGKYDDTFQASNAYHGGGGHGARKRPTNKMNKEQLNRRKKEKNARKARRKQK